MLNFYDDNTARIRLARRTKNVQARPTNSRQIANYLSYQTFSKPLLVGSNVEGAQKFVPCEWSSGEERTIAEYPATSWQPVFAGCCQGFLESV